MMARAAYKHICQLLSDAGNESAAFDAWCMLEHVTGISRTALTVAEYTLSAEHFARLEEIAARRGAGYPLQYLLGEWDFLSLTLAVGEGVLIPRPDTELLCETAAELLPVGGRVRIIDLCAGSGCVGLGIASLGEDVHVTAAELSDAAIVYLKRNCERYPRLDVVPVKCDVLRDAERFCGIFQPFDAIVSNPPYIPSGDISAVSQEVQHEPLIALDGADDGLMFYRVIAGEWLTLLTVGGFCAVEVGIGQAADVAAIFGAAGLQEIEIKTDLCGVDRVVCGRKL